MCLNGSRYADGVAHDQFPMVEGRATEFLRQVGQVLHVQRGTPRAEASAARPLKRVLVVDDEPEIVRLLKDVFASFRHAHAYAVDGAPDGVEALSALQHGKYDLVVLDMYMPRMDGLELLKQMRALSMEVPVLMLTGNQSTHAAIEAICAQVFSYMSKPLDLHYFEHIVALALSSPRPTVGGSTAPSVRATGVTHLDPQSASR